MATLSYNRIAISFISLFLLWIIVSTFRHHPGLSLQDLKNIANDISISSGIGAHGKGNADQSGSTKGSQSQEEYTGSDSWDFEHDNYDESTDTSHNAWETSHGEEYDGPPPLEKLPHKWGTTEHEDSHPRPPPPSSYDEYNGEEESNYDEVEWNQEVEEEEEEEYHHYHQTPPPASFDEFEEEEEERPQHHHQEPPAHKEGGGKTSLGSGDKSSSSSDWDDEQKFKHAWLETEIGGRFDGSELARVCERAHWRGNLVLHLMHARGGITNVRASILDFVYFAIITGGDIVLPEYVHRPDDTLDWNDESMGYYGIENMFDRSWFLNVMEEYCPQMKVYHMTEDVPSQAEFVHAAEFQNARSDLDRMHTEEALVDYFDTWLHSHDEFNPESLSIVHVTKGMWAFDLSPRPHLRKTLGMLLKINPHVRSLAATAVYNLRTKHGLSTIEPGQQLYHNAYYGAHLRTEDDAVKMSWMDDYGGHDAQTDFHIAKCKELGLKVIYVATGKQEDVIRFQEKAERSNIQVLSKVNLLTVPQDIEAFHALTWDQHGALDWEVLARASYFSGPIYSSFAWNVALRRYHYNENDKRVIKGDPEAVREDDPTIAWEDGLNSIILRHAEVRNPMEWWAPRGMYP